MLLQVPGLPGSRKASDRGPPVDEGPIGQEAITNGQTALAGSERLVADVHLVPWSRGDQTPPMELSETLIDLSHPIESGMPAYPGLPSPRIEPLLSHAASRDAYGGRAEFTITRVFMAGNTGTYLDSPWHRWPDGDDLSAIALDRLAGLEGVCVDGVPHGGVAIGIDIPRAALHDRAVLIRTRWDARWGTDDYWASGPYLHADAIALLADAKCRLVGVDFSNVDDVRDPARPAHTTLLREGILIVEHLRGLERVPATGFTFSAVPPAIHGAAAFPVRAFATVRPEAPQLRSRRARSKW